MPSSRGSVVSPRRLCRAEGTDRWSPSPPSRRERIRVTKVGESPRPDAGAVIASPPVERVTIVGCGGSGKSYVARELGRLLDLPVIHMDAVYFDDRWNPLPMERFETVQRELVAAPRWVVDGNYNSTLQVRLEAADTVVFMDLPTLVCLWGILSRQLRHGRGQNDQNGVYNRFTRPSLRAGLPAQDAPEGPGEDRPACVRRAGDRPDRPAPDAPLPSPGGIERSTLRPEPSVVEGAPTGPHVEPRAGHGDRYGGRP